MMWLSVKSLFKKVSVKCKLIQNVESDNEDEIPSEKMHYQQDKFLPKIFTDGDLSSLSDGGDKV